MSPPIRTYPESHLWAPNRQAHGLLDWLCVVCCWLLLLSPLTATAQGQQAAPEPCSNLRERTLKPVGPGLWVWEGQAADISPANRGHVATNAVLAGQNGVLVVDPGPSLAHGQALRQAIRCQLGQEVEGVINTHAHAENVMGNAAFAAPVLWIGSSAATQSAMRQRCPGCLASLIAQAGPEAMAGTAIVLPHKILSDGELLDLGTQQWQVRDYPMAHAESNLVLWNASTQTLVTGGLVYMDRLPELAQGSLLGWIASLQDLTSRQAKTVIGTGLGTVADIAATRQYLCDLASAVWSAMDAGWSAAQAGSLSLPAYAGWAGYQARQSFNAQRAWRELEPVWMTAQPRPCTSMPDIGR